MNHSSRVSDGIWPSAWSADGRFIAYTLTGSFPLRSDIWVLPLFGDRKPFPLCRTGFMEDSGVFSPNGRWIAYTTNEDGQSNVFVQPFLALAGNTGYPRDGGSHPVWRADGKELFYLARGSDYDGGSRSTRPVNSMPACRKPSSPTLADRAEHDTGQVYAVTKDGQRFLVNTRPQQYSAAPLTVRRQLDGRDPEITMQARQLIP